MFAFALWDARIGRLIIGRDRLGIKPLYFSSDHRQLLFSSELKGLVAAGIDREPNLEALHHYLTLSYIPAPLTCYKRVQKLLPGHLLVADASGIQMDSYWRLEDVGEPEPLPLPERVRTLRGLLADAVRSHLVSDVPVGVFLSGGLDSATVLSFMRDEETGPISTFSVGFDDPSFNELARARGHREALRDRPPRAGHPAVDRRHVPALIDAFDEPFADSSAIPVYFLSRFARQHVKVVLSGEGGDEIFGGYETYVALEARGLVPAPARVALAACLPEPRRPAARVAPPRELRLQGEALRAWRAPRRGRLPPRVEGAVQRGREGRALGCDAQRHAVERAPVGGPAHGLPEHRTGSRASSGSTSTSASRRHADQGRPHEHGALPRGARAAARSPARRVHVDGAELPQAAASHHQVSDAARGPRSPAAHRAEGPKRGFNVPMPGWLAGDLRTFMTDTLAPERIKQTGIFQPAAVTRLVDEHLDGWPTTAARSGRSSSSSTGRGARRDAVRGRKRRRATGREW
jgi:asparagine synthase (glutamine-hydrolysing)